MKQLKPFWVAGIMMITVGSVCASEPTLTVNYEEAAGITVAIRGSNVGTELFQRGMPWWDYSRGLLQFDLDKIQPENFGKVVSAQLTLQVAVHANPDDLGLEVGALNTAWNPGATWNTFDGETSWPSGNIDNAIFSATLRSCRLPNEGLIQVDVTSIIDAWLFQGLPNHGLLLRMGPVIHGVPDAGAWEVTLSQPILSIELGGRVPTIADQPSRTIRYYPSALLPPVREPYVFYWEFGAPPDYPGRVANTWNNAAAPSQGMLPLVWFYGPQNPYLQDHQAFVDAYIRVAQSETFGIMVDEWQSVAGDASMEPHSLHPDDPFGLTGSLRGIIEATKIRPELYITVAWRGEDNISPEAVEAIDLLLIESYSHLPREMPMSWSIDIDGVKNRIDTARRYGMIERTIVWLGFILAPDEYPTDHVLTAEEFERQVAEYRLYAPEMPGLAFYANTNEDLAIAADRIARKYFIDPAPQVRFLTPACESSLFFPHVELRADANGQDGRAISRYDWFVDNRLVAQTTSNTWIWDTRDVQDGYHLLTVHAIDENWNRSAAQIPVKIRR